MEAERIVLEPTEDGKRWRVKVEGGDTEGHMAPRGFDAEGGDVEGHAPRGFDARGGHVEGHAPRGFEIEPAGAEGGEPVYRVSLDGEDVEGHRRSG